MPNHWLGYRAAVHSLKPHATIFFCLPSRTHCDVGPKDQAEMTNVSGSRQADVAGLLHYSGARRVVIIIIIPYLKLPLCNILIDELKFKIKGGI